MILVLIRRQLFNRFNTAQQTSLVECRNWFFTYHAFTLNIGVGISKFNPDEEKGHTKYLDLQGHFYARKWNIDLLGEFYHGLYLTPEGLAAPTGEKYYLRPDMGLSLRIGICFFTEH